MKNNRRIFIIALVCIMVFIPIWSNVNASTVYNVNELSKEKANKIEEFITEQMNESKIPGLSVVIVKDSKCVYKKAFGYSNKDTKKAVTNDTLFELGSTSKAFTALAVLQLEKNGLINLNDSVDKYIPWFKMKYKGEETKITLEQLLHHTSGIAFKSIDKIPQSEADNALEETVKTLVGHELEGKPGEKFAYATINYDVLGLVIKNISKQSYEGYIKKNILDPLGMESTFLFRKDAVAKDMAKGYKMAFLNAREYNAPMYRGNAPAGYIITNANDMEKWLNVQLGTNKFNSIDNDLISKSHISDTLINKNREGVVYAAGWFVDEGKGEVFHGGNNPNFSSAIELNTKNKTGVAVLTNMDSDFTEPMANNILNIIEDKEIVVENLSDIFITVDKMSLTVICVVTPFVAVIMGLFVLTIVQIIKGKRRFVIKGVKSVIGYGATLLFILAVEYFLYKTVPVILYNGVTWNTLTVWAPKTLSIAVLEIGILSFLLYGYLVLISLFKKSNDRSYFSIIALSSISGLGNALIIFMINEALRKSSNVFQLELFMCFILGIALYVFGQKIVRTKLIKITNDIVYKLRINLMNKILKGSYEDFEKIENGKIQAAMNNDTETISNFANIIITGITSLITLICCFIYLGIISLYGLLLSVSIILIIASIYFLAGRSANKLWENTRDIQNIFFSFIDDIIGGFKELSLHKARCEEFKKDMKATCVDYRDKRGKADLSFANVFVIGELLFTLAIGVVAFVFPVVLKTVDTQSLISYIFVLLYMTGPVHVVLDVIPNLIQVKISWKRVNQFINEIAVIEDNDKEENQKHEEVSKISLELKDVAYEYSNEGGEIFKVGPINYTYNSGETIFITGGNGSGKSTLAKIITGLYTPKSGEILLNGKKILSKELSQKYSTVFSDFYLFKKMYGLDHKNKGDDIEKYLVKLQIKDKLEIKKGEFSTIKLSTGQRKRVALMVSYLEDRLIYLFDEWAADQDPEFRKFFYMELLPELKDRGKCVIVITHDDRYFKLADKVIKMEFGNIVDEELEDERINIAATIQS